MIKDLDANPRHWTKDDVQRVREYCHENGGGKTQLFPTIVEGGEKSSPTWCEIDNDGVLLVWFYTCLMKVEWRFKP